MTSRGREPSTELAEERRVAEVYAVEPAPGDATVTPIDADDIPALQIVPQGAGSDTAFIHFHGGGYRQGSPRFFAARVARIAKATRTQVFAVRYRLAPEHPFPAALVDAVRAYEWVLKSGIRAERIVLWGDSAGGGLAAALLLRIAELGLERPAGAALFSAWLDLRVTASSYAENAKTDNLFSADRASTAAELYLDGADPNNPLISPVLGNWTGQPPLLIHVSEIEVLRDDSLLLAKVAAAAGVVVRLEKFAETQHIWPIMDFPSTDESVQAVENLGDFLAKDLKLANAGTPLA